MILRSIEISGWRCFVEPFKIGPFSDGLNIIYGPNGTGKSTIFEALLRGLIDSHRVTGRDVELLRPWGRALSPRVTIEFDHNGEEYRIYKQFLDSPFSRLESKEDGRFRPGAENDKADEIVRSIITKNPPGRGFSQTRNWGLAQVLWAPQGNLHLRELSDDIVSGIREMLGLQIAGPGGSPIEDEIENLYSTYYTKTGKLRSGRDAPEVARIAEQLKDERNRLNEARRKHAEFEELSRHVEELRFKESQIKHDLEEISKRLKEARERAEEYNKLITEKKEKEQAVAALTARYNELKNRIEQIGQLKEEISKLQTQIESLNEELPLLSEEVKQKEESLKHAKDALEKKRSERERIENLEKKANDAYKYQEFLKSKQAIELSIKKAENNQKRLNTLQVEHAKTLAPDSTILKKIRKLIKERDSLNLQLEASMINLEITPEDTYAVTILKGENVGKKTIPPKSTSKFKGAPEIDLKIDGFGRLRAWGPVGDIDSLKKSLSKTINKISKLTEPFGTDDIEKLEPLYDRSKQLEQEIKNTQTELEAVLNGKELEELLKEKESAEVNISRLLEVYPAWQKDAPAPNAVRSEVEELKSNFTRELKTCEADWEKAQQAFHSTKSTKEKKEEKYKFLQKRLGENEEQLKRLTADGNDQKSSGKELKEVSIELDTVKTKLDHTRDELSRFDDDPNKTLDALEREHMALNEVLTKATEAEKKEEGKLEQILSEGTYSMLVSMEEEVSELEDRFKQEHLRASAVKLLYDVMNQCRSEILSSVSKPVEQRATRIFQRIVGRRFDGIQIDETFTPGGIKPVTLPEPVNVQNLSGGESEQLYLATRLALAEVFAKEERQMVVLDDVLTATDSGRLLRVMRVLEEAAERLQILILTCHPERYRALGNAKFFDMEEIVESAASLY